MASRAGVRHAERSMTCCTGNVRSGLTVKSLRYERLAGHVCRPEEGQSQNWVAAAFAVVTFQPQIFNTKHVRSSSNSPKSEQRT
jgi:hypothetical protein